MRKWKKKTWKKVISGVLTCSMLLGMTGGMGTVASAAGAGIPFRNQGSYGTDWAHSAIACAEESIIKWGPGFMENDKDREAGTINLSEFQAAYFRHHNVTDPLGNLNDSVSGGTYKNGESIIGQINRFAQWVGPVSENTYAQAAYSNMGKSLDNTFAFQKDAAHLQEVVTVKGDDTTNQTKIQTLLGRYGACTYELYTESSTIPTNEVIMGTEEPKTNDVLHHLAIVGYDGSNWLCKDSKTRREIKIAYTNKKTTGVHHFLKFDKANNYEFNYQYDGALENDVIERDVLSGSMANVFTAKSNNTLKAVSFYTDAPNVKATVSVYKSFTGSSSTGYPVGTATYDGTEAGYHTVKLTETAEKGLNVKKGEKFAVAVKLSSTSNSIGLTREAGDKTASGAKSTAVAKAGESYFRWDDGEPWQDVTTIKAGDNEYKDEYKDKVSVGNFRIKVFADTTCHQIQDFPLGPQDNKYSLIPISEWDGLARYKKDGSDFKFKLHIIDTTYTANDFMIQADGAVLTPDSNGVYTIKNITKDIKFSVKDKKAEVTILYSSPKEIKVKDEKGQDAKNGNVTVGSTIKFRLSAEDNSIDLENQEVTFEPESGDQVHKKVTLKPTNGLYTITNLSYGGTIKVATDIHIRNDLFNVNGEALKSGYQTQKFAIKPTGKAVAIREKTGAWKNTLDYTLKKEGKQEVSFYLAQDTKGTRESRLKTISLCYDTTGPTDATIQMESSNITSKESKVKFSTVHDGKKVFSISAKDALSGVERTEYYIDRTDTETVLSDSTVNSYSWTTAKDNKFTYTEEGKFVIYARGVDNAGNTGTIVHSQGMVIDSSAPTVSDVAVAYADKHKKYMGHTVTITASDTLSGVAEYSIDGGQTWQKDKVFTLNNGVKKILAVGDIKVKDVCGNIASYSKEVIVPASDSRPVTMKVEAEPVIYGEDMQLEITLDSEAVSSFAGFVTITVNGQKIERQVDETGYFTVEIPASVYGKEGTKTVSVNYNGNAANINNASASISVKVTKEEEDPEEPELPKVKQTVTYSGAVYYVKSVTAGKRAVEYVKPSSKKKTSLTVPTTIKINGYTFNVTSIRKRAFYGCKSLKKVTIGSNVTTLGVETFYKCSKLKSIIIKSSKVKKVGKNALKSIYKKCVIKVPSKKLTAYKKLFKSKGQAKTVVIKKM